MVSKNIKESLRVSHRNHFEMALPTLFPGQASVTRFVGGSVQFVSTHARCKNGVLVRSVMTWRRYVTYFTVALRLKRIG